MARFRRGAQLIALIALFISLFHAPQVHAQSDTRYFPETGRTVQGRFLQYWNDNGGLMQQGYPISTEMQERSDTDGKIYTVQYFERAVFEKHPENAYPFDVLLSLLGVQKYKSKYPDGAPNQRPNDEAGSVYFKDTGKRVGGSFLVYFNEFGGVPQQGLPISDEFQERSELDGKVRTVQYFERAVFEWNPDNTPPYNVLLAQLGTFAYKAKYEQPAPPPLLEPQLPEPLDPTKNQYSPQASGRYMVWNEGNVSGSYGQIPIEFDIRALDLATNKPITVTTAPGNQIEFALDGSLVAWENENYGCDNCPPNGLYATDLATGQEYVIALDDVSGNPLTMRDPAVAGRYVIWREIGNNNRQRLLMENVDTGANFELRSLLEGTPDVQTDIGNVQGSGRFVVWSERSGIALPSDPGNSNPLYPFSIHVYDIATDRQFVVMQNDTPGAITYDIPAFSLSGNTLAVADKEGNIILIDLVTRTQVDMPIAQDVFDLHLYGDKLLINTTFESTDIWGLDLSKPEHEPVPLLQPPAGTPAQRMPRYTATIAGDWLVWSEATAPQPRLSKKMLDLTPAGPSSELLPPLPPPDKYREQNLVAASDHAVVWWDCAVNGRTEGQPVCRLRGFNLGLNTEFTTLPDLNPETAVEVVLSGGLLVWRTNSICSGCPDIGIYAVDLDSGKSYTVVSGPVNRYNVAAYGNTVVWIEEDANSVRVMGKNLDTGEYKNYRELSTTPPTISNLQITDQYLAWNEQDTEHLDGKKSHIQVYNRGTGDLSRAYSYDWNEFTIRSLRIALDGTRLAVKYADTFFVRDLLNDTDTNLDGSSFTVWMQLREDALVYASAPTDPGPYGGITGVGIYGIDLKDPGNTLTLVPRHESGTEYYTSALAGPWLIYSNRNAQQSRLLSLRLPESLWR